MPLKIGRVIVFSILFTGSVFAQDLIITPQKGQTPAVMERDRYACYSWAKHQTGFDPMGPATPSTPPPVQEKSRGGLLKGAAGGALVGTGIGAIAGDTGKGAAIGAVHGALIGGLKRHKDQSEEEKKQQQWAQEQEDLLQQKRGVYNRAFSACMEGRDYTVK
jgi:hypothetical protein